MTAAHTGSRRAHLYILAVRLCLRAFAVHAQCIDGLSVCSSTLLVMIHADSPVDVWIGNV